MLSIGVQWIEVKGMNLKGSLPLLVLHILAQGANHGYGIAKQIKEQSRGVLDFKEGTLYPTLHGMEKQGLIAAYEQEESGRLRRYYRLTKYGQAVLDEQLEEWSRYTDAVNLVLRRAET
jgi:PadR family transcriptional regulator PadR